MRVWSANLGRGVSTDEFTRNLTRVLEAGGPRSVFCFQEIDEADAPEEMDVLIRLATPTHWLFGLRTAVPILVPHHLRTSDLVVTPACKGLAKFTPNRVVNEVVIELGVGLKVAVLNTHLPLNRPQTFTRRRDVRRALRRRAAAHEAGVWSADTNTHKGWPPMAAGEVDVIDAGIDKAKAWGPGDRQIVVSEQRTVDLSIDGHNAHGARIRWVRK